MGVCDRDRGVCMCYDYYGSSNGTAGFPGTIGDCAYYAGRPLRNEAQYYST
jgi:hypothetical protein